MVGLRPHVGSSAHSLRRDPDAPCLMSGATHGSAVVSEAWNMSAKKSVPRWVYFIPFMIAGLIVLVMAYGLVKMSS
jgi:hypothetical protein